MYGSIEVLPSLTLQSALFGSLSYQKSLHRIRNWASSTKHDVIWLSFHPDIEITQNPRGGNTFARPTSYSNLMCTCIWSIRDVFTCISSQTIEHLTKASFVQCIAVTSYLRRPRVIHRTEHPVHIFDRNVHLYHFIPYMVPSQPGHIDSQSDPLHFESQHALRNCHGCHRSD